MCNDLADLELAWQPAAVDILKSDMHMGVVVEHDREKPRAVPDAAPEAAPPVFSPSPLSLPSPRPDPPATTPANRLSGMITSGHPAWSFKLFKHVCNEELCTAGTGSTLSQIYMNRCLQVDFVHFRMFVRVVQIQGPHPNNNVTNCGPFQKQYGQADDSWHQLSQNIQMPDCTARSQSAVWCNAHGDRS